MKVKETYIEFLRIFATLFVLLDHVAIAGVNYFSNSITKADKIAGYFIRNISHFSVPIFIMITGYLLLNPNKDVTYKKIRQYILRIVVVLFTFGTAFAWMELLFTDKTLTLAQPFIAIYNVVIGNGWDHMWYLYVLIGLYLITPMLRSFVKYSTQNDIKYILIVSIVFLSLLPMINNLLNIKIGFTLPISTIYPLYYILGYYIGTSKKEINNSLIYMSIIIPTIIIICSTIIAINYNNTIIMTLSDYYSICIVILSIGLFLLGKKNSKWTDKSYNKVVKVLSRTSFGIYIIHMVFINIIYKVLKLNPFTNILNFIIISLLVTGLSFISSYIMTKIPILNKYI